MAKLSVFDTSIFSPFRKQIEKKMAFALLPSIVLYELQLRTSTNRYGKGTTVGDWFLTKPGGY